MSQFNYKQTFNQDYFVGSGAVLTDPTKTTADLVPLQIGIFNAKNYKALAAPTNAKQVPDIIIAYGSPNESNKVNWTNVTESFKTVPINANKLVSYRKSYPVKALNHKVAVGWDGVNDCKNLSIVCGETYTLGLQIEGNPATRFYGQKPLTTRYVYTAPACCPDGVTSSADVEKMVDFFVNSINSDKFISPFVRADKIVSYNVAPTPSTLDYESYTLTIADAGGIADLAKIQALYPDAYSITRTKRDGIYSTYTLIQLESESTPSEYTAQATITIPDCEDCPSGYTLVPAYDQFKLEILDDGNDNSTFIEIVLTESISIEKISGNATTGIYIVIAPVGEYTVAEIVDSINEESDITPIVTSLGKSKSYCELTSGVTVAWVAGDNYFREGREICLTLGDEACSVSGDSQLAQIAAYYDGSDLLDAESIAEDADGQCANSYTATQYSSNLLKDDECYTGIATYPSLPSYKGFSWDLCPCVEKIGNDVTNIGIILTGAYVDTKFGDCAFKYSDFVELDLPRIIVTQGNPLDELGKCGKPWDITELQRPQYPTGTGENVKRAYIQATQLRHQMWTDDPRWREIYGFNYEFIDRKKSYKTYYLEFVSTDKTGTTIGYTVADQKTTVILAFPEDADTTALEAVLEGWITSVRPDLVDGDYKDNNYR